MNAARDNELANSEEIVVGVVGEGDSAARATIFEVLAAAGAEAVACTQATAISKAIALDALVFDVGNDPETLLPVAVALAGDPRTRWMPRVVVVGSEITAPRIAPFGPAVILAGDAPRDVVAATTTTTLEEVRAKKALVRLAQETTDELRLLEETLSKVERDGTALSHDARVLFGVILGFACNLRDGFGGPITPEQKQQLINIVEASNDASALLDHYAEDLQEKLPRASEPLRASVPRVTSRRHNDLGELVRGTVSLFHGAASAKGIQLRTDAARAVHSWCDAMQVKQALVNLVSNALKFTPAGGRIEVSARFGPPSSARNGSSARRDIEIVVSDTGPGIPRTDRERIFERGVRLARDTQTPGTGLGLAIVRDVMDLHGGTVRIEDTPGGGTSIVLVFPVDLRTRKGERRGVVVASTPSVPPPSSRRSKEHGEIGKDSE